MSDQYDTPLIGNAKKVGQYGKIVGGIRMQDAQAFVNEDGWLNFVIFEARSGKLYIKPDTFKPEADQQQQPQQPQQPPPPQSFDTDGTDPVDEVPF